MDVIEVKNVTKKFGNHTAVNNVSLSIPKHKIFGLLGSNGAGKTTTINMLTGLLLPSTGSISILGMDALREIETIRHHIALVPQTISLYTDLTIHENIEFFGGLFIKDNSELKKKIEEMITIFRLEERKNFLVSDVSGGFQRRCSIACALVSSPKILFLDEPLTGIDIYTNEIIMKFLKSIKDITIIFTTHSIKEAEEICDYVVFMDRSEKILEGTPEQIVKRYSKALGEQVFIEFDKAVDVVKVEKHLEKSGYNIKNLKLSGNVIYFTSKDLGNSVIEVIDSMRSLKKHVINIDIKKPTLEHIFEYVMKHRK